MVRYFLRRPIGVFMVTLALSILGIIASTRIPTSLMPDISIPEITVHVPYENLNARELENTVIRPLRNQLLQVSSLKDIETESMDGFGIIKMRFEYGTNTDYAFIETNEKIDAALTFLPRDMEIPRVIKASASDIPILNLTVSLKDQYSEDKFLNLSEFAETVIKKRIEQLPEIALADISGQSHTEVVVSPNINLLNSLGVDNDELISGIVNNNFDFGNLVIQNGIYQYNFSLSNDLKTIKDIEDIYINLNGKILQLKDLAKVSIRPKPERGMVYSNNNRAVVLSIIKQSDAKVYDLKETLNDLTVSFNKDYPDLLFEINQDQSELLKLSIDNLKSNMWMGIFLAILIMFVFLGDFQSPLISMVSIPLSLILSMLMIYACGLSINIISLSGLILGCGLMIDNTIIVIENITQKIEKGYSLFDSCIQGTNEVISPLISSTLTNISVFLPLIFLSGISGALFYDQAIAVTIGLVTSVIVSITIIPVLFFYIKNIRIKFLEKNIFQFNFVFFDNLYESGYLFFSKRKWIVYLISLLSLVIAALLIAFMDYSQLPVINQNETVLLLDWNETVNVNENQKRISTLLKTTKDIKSSYVEVGEQQFLLQKDKINSHSESRVYIKSTSNEDLLHLKSALTRKISSNYPLCNFRFIKPKTIFDYIFDTDKPGLTARIFSRSSQEVPSELEVPAISLAMQDISNTRIPIKESSAILIKNEKLILYDIEYSELLNQLKTVFNKNFVDHLRTSQNSIPIMLGYDYKTLESINFLFVKNRKSIMIPVRSVIEIKSVFNYKSLRANKSGEFIEYIIDDKNINLDMATKTIRNKFDINNGNYIVRFSGSSTEIEGLNNDLFIIIIVSILLLYLIMASQFESLWQPLVILLEIPIDVGGALLLLWIFGGTINIMSLIGIVVMSGVVINDSILKVHTINLILKHEKVSVDEAVMQAGKSRLNSILMTTLTTVLALLPILFSDGLGEELQKPLALTVVGGMILGTFISLYFVPFCYQSIYKFLHRT